MKKKAPAATGARGQTVKRPQENTGDEPANATDKARYVSKAPRPITVLSGGGGYNPPRDPVPLRSPELPSHYPSFLKVRTSFVCTEAIRKHKDRTRAIDAACDIVRELSTDSAHAVRENKLRADLALSNMEALVEQFAYVNSDGNGQIALKEAIKNSEAWREFIKAIIAAERTAANAVEVASAERPVIQGTPVTLPDENLGDEIRNWMKKEDLSNAQACKRFDGISVSTLKAMKSGDKKRYGRKAVNTVLSVIRK